MTAANEPILLRRDRGHGIVHLTLNRPKAFNSLSSELMSAMQTELDQARDDSSIRLFIIEG
ncbi:MAG: enoyl-CoA hydratase/isomerase family protein, partial [Alphaproteobacteria bacterium]